MSIRHWINGTQRQLRKHGQTPGLSTPGTDSRASPFPSLKMTGRKVRRRRTPVWDTRQQPCHPEEARTLATRGLANEGSMQFSTLGRRPSKRVPHISRFSRCGSGQHPDPESNHVGRTLLSAAVDVGSEIAARKCTPQLRSMRLWSIWSLNDAWYIIPIEAIGRSKAIYLYPHGSRRASCKFEKHREAWSLMESGRKLNPRS